MARHGQTERQTRRRPRQLDFLARPRLRGRRFLQPIGSWCLTAEHEASRDRMTELLNEACHPCTVAAAEIESACRAVRSIHRESLDTTTMLFSDDQGATR